MLVCFHGQWGQEELQCCTRSDVFFADLSQVLVTLECVCVCVCNVWHTQLGSRLGSPALGKWCCLSSFTTPDAWVPEAESAPSAWPPGLSQPSLKSVMTQLHGSEGWEVPASHSQLPEATLSMIHNSRMRSQCLFTKGFASEEVAFSLAWPSLASLWWSCKVQCCVLYLALATSWWCW